MTDWREKKCAGLIYLLTSKSDKKKYVGLTRRPIEVRMDGHKKSAADGRGTKGSLQEAIRKFGFENFNVEILDQANTLGELSDKEREYINKYDSIKPNGYNHNRGGSVAVGGKPFEFLGEVFMSLANLADYYQIYEETLRKRIHAGWSLEQATELKPPPDLKRGGKRWKFDGYEFSSTSELCKYFKVDPLTFKVRITNGLTVQEACGLHDIKRATVFFKGVEYSTIRELATAYNLEYGRVVSRLRAGHTLEYAMDAAESPNRFRRKPIEIDGKAYKSKSEAAKQLGLTTGKLEKRLHYLNSTQSKAKLVELRKKKYQKRKRTLIVQGRLFNSIIELSKYYNIPEGTIRSRLNRGESVEQAVGLISDKSMFPLKFKGKVFNSQREITEYYGVKRATFAYRIKQKSWSLEQALGLEKKTFEGKKIHLNGMDFPSISSVARHFKIDISTFNRRLNDGWTMEEACGLEQRTQPHAQARVYVITHPNGTEETISNLSEFGRKHNLKNIGNLAITIKSDVNHSYKGFRLRYANEREIDDFLTENPNALASRSGFKSKHLVSFNGKVFKSKRELCRETGISYNSFCKLLNFGSSVAEAVEHCLKQSNKSP